MNLLEVQLRAASVQDLFAESFERQGFKTEGRKLKIQSGEVLALVKKALDEMPKFERLEVLVGILGGKSAVTYREKRRVQGKYYERIGKAEKAMLKTLRSAFDSFYKTRADWTRRQQINATTRMIKAVIEMPKKQAKELMAATPKP
jgi:hypothetical protein